MKTLALAMAAAATLAFTAPSFAASAASSAAGASPDRIQLAQADVKVRVGGDRDRGERRHHRMHREVRMHRGYDRRESWRHRDHGKKVVIIKKHRNGTTVIKKRIEG